MVYRKRSLYRFRSRSKYGKRRYISKRIRSARIKSKFLRRRPQVPEIKFDDVAITSGQVPPTAQYLANISPLSLIQGTTENTRIGSSVKIRHLRIEYRIYGDSTSQVTARIPEAPYRVVLWTPRIDYANAQNYMSQIQFDETVNHNVVTVHKDWRFVLKSAYGYGVSVPSNFSGPPFVVTGIWRIPFPRNAKFNQSDRVNPGIFDIDKDVLYVTFLTQDLGGAFNSRCRLFFTDS